MLLYRFIVTALTLALIGSLPAANAHPGEIEPMLNRRQLEQRQAAANARHAVARNCDKEIWAFEEKRRVRRAALVEEAKKTTSTKHKTTSTKHKTSSTKHKTTSTRHKTTSTKHKTISTHKTTSTEVSSTSATSTSTGDTPTYTALQNTTCVLTPEAEEGPYYIHEELIRTDIRDGMDGLPLLLDIGVMDVTTCTPMEAALVDIWHCNATGIYSGFIASEASNVGTTNTISTGTGGSNSSLTTMPTGSALPSGSMSMSMSMGGNGTNGTTGGGGGGGGGAVATDEETFGRGAYPTNANGLVEFSTIVPGFYSGRAMHIHTVVLTNYTTNSNGTVGLEAGHIQHVGQLFFEESWSELIVATAPYNTETIERTTNDVDRVYAIENTAGFNATMQLSKLGSDLSDGLLGYITLGINPSASYTLASTSYYTGED